MKFPQGDTSLINWLKLLGAREGLLRESVEYDTKKTERLRFLHEVMGLPMPATDFIAGADFDMRNEVVRRVMRTRGGLNRRFCFRVAPLPAYTARYPVVKKYGLTFPEFAKRFARLPFDPSKTVIRVTDYGDKVSFAAIVIVGKEGIIGEVCQGTLYHLTYARKPTRGVMIAQFFRRFNGPLVTRTANASLKRLAAKIVNYLHVPNARVRSTLRRAGFTLRHNFLSGYFEYVQFPSRRGVFTDINNKRLTTNLSIPAAMKALALDEHGSDLRGMPIAPRLGTITGVVQVITDRTLKKFVPGNILACSRTDARYLPLMRTAKAVVTDHGGITSHPAIIARELGVPCIVGAKDATRLLRSGQKVRIDMTNGSIVKLKHN